jgi:hypothetical protein
VKEKEESLEDSAEIEVVKYKARKMIQNVGENAGRETKIK